MNFIDESLDDNFECLDNIVKMGLNILVIKDAMLNSHLYSCLW